MKLCIPVRPPAGLESLLESDFSKAQHLLLFDTETRACSQLGVPNQEAGAPSALHIDALLCAGLDRRTLLALARQGIGVYATTAPSAAQAIAEYESGGLEAQVIAPERHGGHCHGAAHHAGGCCSGHSHANSRHGGAAHESPRGTRGDGCVGHGKGDAHEAASCCASRGAANHARSERPLGEFVRIAVSSQNRKTVTEHAGKCRKFWIFDVRQGQVTGKTLLELPIDQTLHAASRSEAHPLDTIDVLITSGIGAGLEQRLRLRGIEALLTVETDPDRAVSAYLAGRIATSPVAAKSC